MNVVAIIPALNAAERIPQLMMAIQAQILRPSEVLIIDSNSRDRTAEVAKQWGARVLSLGSSKFNHGATRQWAIEQTNADIAIFLTDDAIPADNSAFSNLCRGLEKIPDCGIAYGRQIPTPNATPLATHHRNFNYPKAPHCWRKADIAVVGMKAFFVSNSFAAYKRQALISVEGFPTDTIFGEDAYVAARMILAGYAVLYVPEAQVVHSHNYTLAQEFRRYFDAGVFHARNPWLKKQFGGPTREGLRFVKSEMQFLASKNMPHLIPVALIATALKYFGFFLGKREATIPLSLKRNLSLYRGYWDD